MASCQPVCRGTVGKGIYEGASGRVCILSWLQPGAQQLLGSPISPVIAQSDGHCRRWRGERGQGPIGSVSKYSLLVQEVPDLSLSKSLLQETGTLSLVFAKL